MRNGILITGATSDIGYEFLKSFSEKDKVVIAFYHDYEERLDILENEYNLEIIRIKFNFLEPENLKDILEEKIKNINITEVIHLAAPVVKQERFNKVDLLIFKNDFSIQVLSIVEILKVIIPKMKKEKKGKIIFILSSVVKGVPPKFWTSYVTCKYALNGLLKSLVAEYSSFNIQINAISPSMINSKFLKNMDERLIETEIEKHPLKRTIRIEEIVETINYILKSKNEFLNGNNILLTGGENF